MFLSYASNTHKMDEQNSELVSLMCRIFKA